MNKIRVGIIGTGGISHMHMAGYGELDNVEVVAACDLNRDRAEEFAEKYGVNKVYDNFEEMLNNEILDAVSVTTWNNAHMVASVKALQSGVNVLCEKPMAMNTEQALLMKEAADKSGKLLMIGFVRRFGTNVEIAREFIDNGELGEIYYARTKCVRRCGNPLGWFSDKERSGGGPLIDLGVHIIDLSRYLMGKPKAVSVYGATFDGIGPRTNIKNFARYTAKDISYKCDVEDFATALVRFDNGAVLNVEVSFSAHIQQPELTLELLGTKGGIKIEPELEFYSEKYNRLIDLKPVYTISSDIFVQNFTNEIKHFIDCIEGKTECRNLPEDGIELMKILDAIYESARTKKEIILD